MQNGTDRRVPIAQIAGLNSTGAAIWNEEPAGPRDGINLAFTLAQMPDADSVRLFINGLRARPGPGNDYTLNAGTLTLSEAPLPTDVLLVDYSASA